jgi:Ca2+-transporting ATPase
VLQFIAVHWKPAQTLFGTTYLSGADWLLATFTASSVLLLDEARKWLICLHKTWMPK